MDKGISGISGFTVTSLCRQGDVNVCLIVSSLSFQ